MEKLIFKMTAPVATKGNATSGTTIPNTMVEALDFEDPYDALMALSHSSKERAVELSKKLVAEISEHPFLDGNNNNLPDLLKRLPNTQDADSHPVATAIACSDSILHSLTKIASGGSQASQEIIQLEQEKRELDRMLLTALIGSFGLLTFVWVFSLSELVFLWKVSVYLLIQLPILVGVENSQTSRLSHMIVHYAIVSHLILQYLCDRTPKKSYLSYLLVCR